MTSNRAQRKKTAEETLEILKSGKYTVNGVEIDISNQVSRSVMKSRLFEPETWPTEIAKRSRNCTFSVKNETTFAGARRLLNEGFTNPICLNFASAMNPGGGFLNGSQAQEEALSRSSGLYPCLDKFMDRYLENRRQDSKLYLDNVIYSPQVPVFRDDSDRLLSTPYEVSIVSAAAPNKSALMKSGDDAALEKIHDVFTNRVKKVLTVAATAGHQEIVLGAWGCGVFGNDPREVATMFLNELNGQFRRVHLAVLDKPNGPTISAFKEVFSKTRS